MHTQRAIHRFSGVVACLGLSASLLLGACDKNQPEPTAPTDDQTADATEPEQVEEPARVYPEPPGPGEQRPVNFPELQKYELPNRLSVYIVENHEVPIVDVQLVVKAGTIHGELLAGMTASMLTEGTKKRTKAKIDEAIEQVGSSLEAGAGEFSAFVSTRVLTPDLPLALDLVNDVVQNPKFDQEAIDKLKEQQKTAIKSEKSDGGALAQRLVGKLLYPEGHPYGQTWPSAAELDGLTATQLAEFHSTWYRPNNAYLILSGDVTKADVEKAIEKTLGKWKPAESFPKHPLEKFSPQDYQAAVPTDFVVHVVDRNQISSDIVIANINSVARNSPEWTKMAAVTKLFGGGMSSRLFRDIREERKLTYNINSFEYQQKAVGAFAIVTQTKDTDEMLNAVFDHVERLRTTDPSEQEFQATVDNMALSFPLQIETASQIAGKVNTLLTYNLPEDYYNTYIDEVRKIELADIKATAAKHIHPIPVIVVVGKAMKVEKQLKNVKRLEGAKIIKYNTDLEVVN
ncbi:insulinase family protein [Pseudenhygromyxa sp. WMMC2535]|uniref:M16 family metallopeptidase n=1 Tax=Pseudenhygromyxa sp. WMMC2535 TaxID=2712867 RepID=UPI0015529B84|nr:pitrilysin family protein [Pseudenhygromyxa sp. WMMC2535]NVB37370.1 insulinase family protein [Pseudenhygromyxa sp. WMMC2535]